ncbi:MAG: TetR/AcrR family transcriptional regulator [Alphaproteobacteria bacterium]|nr:TetR/AcrR family transcriptional regulator [Alphaproteobacteria bacterium]NCQ88876.1 TetR/AcrR family transcriptional regulator [Alphaproteobacteria bacterium]NCT07779.1 TetR/AcrR family transcriptional regulator [Alphaproteobacteria bacterium]
MQKIPKTKENLLNTAISLVWRNSYGLVTIDDICKEAGVLKGSFYHYFGSKQDLTIQSLDYFYTSVRPMFENIFSPEKEPVQRFEDYCNFVYKSQKELKALYGHVCGCPYASLGCEMSNQDDEIKHRIEEVFTLTQGLFAKTIKDLIDDGLIDEKAKPTDKAHKAYTYVIGVMMMARIQNDLNLIKREMRSGLFNIIGINVKTPKPA